MTPAPEFSRIEKLDTIGGEDRSVAIVATDAERAALAARFGLIAIDRLEAGFRVRREAGGVSARGRVEADVVQACSVTGDPVPARVDETVTLRFVEESTNVEEEIELGEESLDTIEIHGGGVDLGEAAAETMALALPPFPRSKAAAKVLKEAGVIGEDEVEPLGALSGLKALLEGKK
jgi:uncharacterized metal-binding protein YceD (DUF177 family)